MERRRRLARALTAARCSPLLLLLVLAGIVCCAHGAVLGIDLGSEFIKVSIVKPGRAPVGIVTNEMSKRKTPNLVGFYNGERLLGDEVAALVPRIPTRVYSHTRELLGRRSSADKAVAQGRLESRALPYELKVGEDGELARWPATDVEYTAEELTAMVLRYVLDLGEAFSHLSPIKDAVVTVPPYFSLQQRQALLDAAQIAGVNVMALIGEHAAAALQYGIDRDFSNSTQHVVFYDMGASSTYAALVRFSAYTVKEYGKNKTYNQFEVLGVRWDADLGGSTLDMQLLKHFAEEFKAKTGLDARQSPKAVAKLKKEVKRTKEVLSANTEAPFNVESLYEDRDFRSSLTRDKFEELCSDVWPRLALPVLQLLQDAQLTIDQVDAVEVIGGSTRVPKVQAALSEALGGRTLDRHMDADEAIALGAGLHAANLSTIFRMRQFGMVDIMPYGISVQVSGSANPEDAAPLDSSAGVDEDKTDSDGTEGTDEEGAALAGVKLVPRGKKIPAKRAVAMNGRTSDFSLALAYDEENSSLPPGTTSADIASFEIAGVSNISSKHNSTGKVTVHFALSRSGILSLDKAELSVRLPEVEEKPVKPAETISASADVNATLDSNTTANASSVDGNASAVNTTRSALNETQADGASKPVLKRKARMARLPLEVRSLSVLGMTEAEKDSSASKLAELRRKDDEKRATAEAKNSLESYILKTRDQLSSNEEFAKVTTAEEREAFLEQLNEAEDWLYMDGADGAAADFRLRLKELHKAGDPIALRASELSARPMALEKALQFITQTRATVASWNSSKPWLNETDKDALLARVLKLELWLNDAEAQQRDKDLHAEPAFLSSSVDQERAVVEKAVSVLQNKPKPKPPKVPKMTVNVTGNASDGNDTSNGSETGEQPTVDSAEIPVDVANEEAEAGCEAESEPADVETEAGSGAADASAAEVPEGADDTDAEESSSATLQEAADEDLRDELR
eukprot:jgi/Chlat1/1335/Chrsp118S01754